MVTQKERIPPGPSEAYKPSTDLLEWMGHQFESFGDIYKASIYRTDVYVTRSAEFAHHVLVKNWPNYIKGQATDRVALLLANGLIVSEGELWKRQRGMIQPAFNHDSIRALSKVISAVNSELLRKWQDAAQRNQSVNVTRDVSGMALEVTLRFIFGDDYAWVRPHFSLLSEDQARNMTFARSFRALGTVIGNVMDRRRKNSCTARDALGIMMQARDPQSGQSMKDRQVIDETLTLIVAGHETSASTLNWTWYLVAQHPAVQQKLSDELDSSPTAFEYDDLPKFVYTRQIIEEAMRLYPAVWFLNRKAQGDDWLGEFFVPSGTEIYLSNYYIQRHPILWKDPDQFDPDRFLPENTKDRHRLATLPFSAGPRNCIGSHLARIEMQIHLMTIARHLHLRYVSSEPIELDAGVNLRNKYDFIMYPENKINSCS